MRSVPGAVATGLFSLANSTEALIETGRIHHPSGLPAWGPRSAPGTDCVIVADLLSSTPYPTAARNSRSITQLVLKEEATDLNRRAPIDGRTDEQRADHAALAIDARVDTADAFTA